MRKEMVASARSGRRRFNWTVPGDCATWGLYVALGSDTDMPYEEGQISGLLCASVSLLDTGSDDS